MSREEPRRSFRGRYAPPDVETLAGLPASGPAALWRRWILASRRRRETLHLFEPEEPTPPRRDPTHLPGSLWAVAAFYSPAGYATPLENYRRFRQGLREQSVPLLAVELGFGDRPFDLAPDDADLLVQIRGGDALWQKERLLNLGISRLPEDCDKVAWLDADILFDRPDWAVETARLLQEYVVVQPYLERVRLGSGGSPADVEALPVGLNDGEVYYGMAYGVAAKGYQALDSHRRHGSTGLAWAARRDLLDKHGLYERELLGGGDTLTARGMFRAARIAKPEHFSPKALEHLRGWAEPFHADVRGSVAYVAATVFHLWHGSREGRRYGKRRRILVDHDYDPERDVEVGPEQAFCWASDKPDLHRAVREYFEGRAEDG